MIPPMNSSADRRVDIVVITYNSNATLPRVLEALAAQTFRDFRVILIDNASRERPAPLPENLPFPVSYMEMADNLGFAEGMNQGLKAATAPYLVALNPDAFPEPAWLAALVDAIERHPEIAALGSLQRAATDDSRIDGFGDHYLLTGQAWRGQTLPPAPATGGPEFCFGVCAAAALYRTEALRTIGGFDGRYFCFYEDVDVSFRLRLAGYHCAVLRSAVVRHVGGASFAGLSDFAERLIARNEWWTLIKNMPWPLLMLSAPAFLLIQLVSLARGRHPARAAGLREALARTGEFWAARAMARSGPVLRWISVDPRLFLGRISVTRPARD
jgi:GT2 family glycosyltransferase